MSKSGRKNAWDNNIYPNLSLIKGWCRDGLIDKEICKNIGISQETFYKYKRLKPEFADVLKETKEVVDRIVENSLYKRAVGYEYEEVTKEMRQVGDGKPEVKHIKKVIKQVVPDTTAQIFWLKNRRPDSWRDKQEISGPGGKPIDHNITINFVGTDDETNK